MIHIVRAFIVLIISYTFWVIANTDIFVLTDTYEYLEIVSSIQNTLHQTGHMIFGVPKTFIGTNTVTTFLFFAGGSLIQWGVPLAITIHLLLSRLYFSGSAVFFWFGYSLYDSVIYMADAIPMKLTLSSMELGRGHDWNILFSQMDLLDKSEQIASGFHAAAIIIFWISTVACVVFFSSNLFRSLRNRYTY